jgi:capsular polysaccharide export protein
MTGTPLNTVPITRVGVVSTGILKINFLEKFLAVKVTPVRWFGLLFNRLIDVPVIVVWGRRSWSYRKGEALAEKINAAMWTIEDGFIRSVGLGKDGFQPLSLVLDKCGIYFDASMPSELEQLIVQGDEDSERAVAAMDSIRKFKLSKYNHAPVVAIAVTPHNRNVLVVDQTCGDQSILLGGADAQIFETMLAQACKNHPDATIWVKTHPDVSVQKRAGYLTHIKASTQIRLLTDAMNPIALLEQMDEVYVVTSQLGFEALIMGKTVHCFGVPWYAGWGLTDDSAAPLAILSGRRGQPRTLSQLFSAAYFHYARYINPDTGLRCELEEAMQWIINHLNDRQRIHSSAACDG